jgi:RIO kinase 1
MATGFEHLLEEGVISEVLGRLQSGKEAEVYVVRFGGKVVAAKVYKDRATRSFKNNAAYVEGRSVRNSRSQRAMDRGTRFGRAAAEEAWKSAEANALYKLHAEGVRVPTPVLFLDGVLLMELVLDANGEPARRLIDTHLSVSDANAAYHDMLGQLVRILSCELIHGDLSPYNVLWGAAGPTVIDFPQIISASHNQSSERFFLRDAENILGHFARIDHSLQARRSDGWEIWQAYVRRELTPEFRPTGRGRPPPPRVEPRVAPQAQRPRMDGRPPPAHGRNHGGGQGTSQPQRPNIPAPLRQPPPRPVAQRRQVHVPEVIVRRAPGAPVAHAPAPPPPPQTHSQPRGPDHGGAGEGGASSGRRRRRRRR